MHPAPEPELGAAREGTRRGEGDPAPDPPAEGGRGRAFKNGEDAPDCGHVVWVAMAWMGLVGVSWVLVGERVRLWVVAIGRGL